MEKFQQRLLHSPSPQRPFLMEDVLKCSAFMGRRWAASRADTWEVYFTILSLYKLGIFHTSPRGAVTAVAIFVSHWMVVEHGKCHCLKLGPANDL